MYNEYIIIFRVIYRLCISIALVRIVHTEILRLPQCDKFDANFSILHNNKMLIGAIIDRLHGLTYIQCTRMCIRYQHCKSINYWEHENEAMESECELNSKEIGDDGVQLVKSSNEGGRSVYAETPKNERKVSCI